MAVKYEFPFGWQELEGVHNRTDFSRRQEFSGRRMLYVDAGSDKRCLPYVVETATGVGAPCSCCWWTPFREEEVGGESRVVLGSFLIRNLPFSSKRP